jgi:hypothetical protein
MKFTPQITCEKFALAIFSLKKVLKSLIFLSTNFTIKHFKLRTGGSGNAINNYPFLHKQSIKSGIKKPFSATLSV